MITKHYKVAGHVFAVSGKAELFEQMGNYEPFECEGGEPLFSLTIECGVVPEYTEVYPLKKRAGIIYGRTASGNEVYDVVMRAKSEACLICSKHYREGRIIMAGDIPTHIFELLMIKMYALATAGNDTLVLHAVVVSCEGNGYIFLGPCGAGKSTHAQLWLKHFEGTELVNDDNPVVRDGVVYGSPWSPITPCYRNVSYPISGFVRLSPAPYNKIHRMSGIEAYLNLYCSDMGRIGDGSIAKNIDECLHQTENTLVSTIPMWHLECLPDEEAARLCYDTITNQGI